MDMMSRDSITHVMIPMMRSNELGVGRELVRLINADIALQSVNKVGLKFVSHLICSLGMGFTVRSQRSNVVTKFMRETIEEECVTAVRSRSQHIPRIPVSHHKRTVV